MAARGMALRSTGAEPRPRVPLTLTTAELWRRLPLASTRVWSGDRPRNCAGRTASLASAPVARAKFSDGSRRASTVASSPEPVLCRSREVRMSIGDSESMVRRFFAKVPVTTTDCSSPSAGTSCCAYAGRAKQAIRLAAITVLTGMRLAVRRVLAGRELIDSISSVSESGYANHGGPLMKIGYQWGLCNAYEWFRVSLCDKRIMRGRSARVPHMALLLAYDCTWQSCNAATR